MEDIWRQAKEDLQGRISSNCYTMWIDPLELAVSREGEVSLACPNRFFLNWVRENYLSEIKRSWERYSGTPQEINLRLATTPRKSPLGREDSSQLPLPLPPQKNGHLYRLNRRFTFDQFVVGSGNSFAYSAAYAIANGDRGLSSCLYLLADTGLGKSHLSHAIGNHILTHNNSTRVFYLTAEEFTNEMVAAIKQRRMEGFKEKYRNICDVLLLEEVQFLSGKEKTQAELAYTLDALSRDDKRIIFTGTHFPRDIPKLKSKLQSRLVAGMVTHIEPPDFQTRLKILEKKAANEGISLPSEVAELLASNITRDVRQLESSVIGIVAKSSLLDKPIDIRLAHEVLESVCDSRETISIERVQQVICQYFKVSVEALKSNSRKKGVVYPRNLGMYFCRKYTEETLESIGQAFNRSHATVIHAVDNISRQIHQKSGVRNQVGFLGQQLENPSSSASLSRTYDEQLPSSH
jgi:chromosomal replication initiator protein